MLNRNKPRRQFLKQSVNSAGLALAVSAGLLQPGRVMAHEWYGKRDRTLKMQHVEEVLRALFPGAQTRHGEIAISSPAYIEKPNRVPITIECVDQNVSHIALLVDDQVPLRAYLHFDAVGTRATARKMFSLQYALYANSFDSHGNFRVIVAAYANGILYRTEKYMHYAIN